ncbi:MAG TPA: septation protein SepH [Actinomycetota bacterium]
MKRIYLVGASDDKKRLQLAQGKGARFGSMELPISPKLRALLREVEAERLAKRGKKPPEEELKEQRTRAEQAKAEAKRAREGLEAASRAAREAEKRAREAEKRAAQAEKRAQRAEEGATEARRRAEEAKAKAEAAEKRAGEVADRVRERSPKPDGGPPAKGGLAPGGFERATGGMEGVHAIIRPTSVATSRAAPGPKTPARRRAPARATAEKPAEERSKEEGSKDERPRKEAAPRRKAPPMPEPKLTPAEIQTLLRSGRGIRSVAKQAEAPVDWVRRLAAPIESERLGVVTQLMQSYVVRARLGRSAVPVGTAIVENLRDRGVRFPERVAEDGWTAWRPDNREWRVRFTYESRGRRQRADWRFEPQSRTVVPENDLAGELAYRAPAEGDGVGGAGAALRPQRVSGGSRAAPAPPTKKSTSKKGSRGRASRKRSAGR